MIDAEQRVAVRHRRRPFAVGDVIDRPRDGRDETERARCLSCQLGRVSGGSDGLDPSHLGLDSHQRRDLSRVAAKDGDVDSGEDPLRRGGAVGRRADPNRIEHDGNALLVRRRPGQQHGLDPVLGEGADVEHERTGETDHLAHLVLGMGHDGQRPEREDRVRRLVHHDVVGDVVDERLALANHTQGRAGVNRHALPFTLRTSTGPSPAPISTRPWRTADEAASDAPRAASSRESPRASSAARVAECVQPAPCVAATS